MHESNARLLIVDDDPELRDLLAEFLNKHGYVAHTVDGGAAMDRAMAESPPYDLLILDLMLPGEGGLNIAKRLKLKVDIPIIILSALGEDVDRIIGLEVGADDYIAKPFNPRELLARIRAVMRRVSRASTPIFLNQIIVSANSISTFHPTVCYETMMKFHLLQEISIC